MLNRNFCDLNVIHIHVECFKIYAIKIQLFTYFIDFLLLSCIFLT